MPFARLNLQLWILPGLLTVLTLQPLHTRGAGVTLVTHGNISDTYSWVNGMANALSLRMGGTIPIYRISIDSNLGATVAKVTGGNPTVAPSGQLIVMLDWGAVSANSTTTFNVAQVVAPLFGQTNLVVGLEGHALGEFPIHLVGHSRGGSLICELSRLLGEQGLWIDQVTGLDPHPISGDAPVAGYENVLFADSYYETNSFLHLLDGVPIPGSFKRRQTTSTGGYEFPFDWHSDVHVWYHGTIDLSPSASNGDGISITPTMRDTWWTSVEQQGTNAGFNYTQFAGGDRFSTNQPNGSNSSPVRDGFNRYYEIGGGTGSANRTPVMNNAGLWPNPIRFDLLSTNVVQSGDTVSLAAYFQWAQPNTSTQTVQVLMDPDSNPLNGNELLLEEGFVSGTTVAQVGYGTIDAQLDGSELSPGSYQLLIRMSAAGRSRFLYAQKPIELIAPELPLWLDITRAADSLLRIGINGVAGQTAVLEASSDGAPWLPLATNTLDSARREILEPVDASANLMLFRAVLATP